MRSLRCGLMAAVLMVIWAANASGAVFQYMSPVKTKKGLSQAFLWVPPEATQIRGVVMGGMTLMEREMARDEVIREACADQQLAIVFLKCGVGAVNVQDVLNDLAKLSGYQELSVAPLMFVGHSAGGPPSKELAREMSDRCFGLVQYRGGVPSGGEPLPAEVPSLTMVGQFDEFGGTMRDESGREGPWERARDEIRKYRQEDPSRLASIVVEPGAGHFAWSDRNARYLALWIRKAAEARIPESWSIEAEKPVELKKVDPKSGWLTDLTIRTWGEHEPAPYEKYSGEKGDANWHFDGEMAQATVAYHAGGFGKKDQFIKWNDRYWVDAGTRFFFLGMKWVADGQTFEVDPAYADKYPGQPGGRGPKWLQAGEPVGHSKAPIRIKPVSGPIKAVGENRFRMHFDELAPATEGSRVTFMAYSEGDSEYRYTEQVGMMPRGFRGLNKGKSQTITFPTIGDVKYGGDPVPLKATSDSGLPVSYHIGYGPARIVDGKLRIVQVPVRAKFPIEVKVVAYQFGSGVEPLVKTAEPVEQVIEVVRP